MLKRCEIRQNNNVYFITDWLWSRLDKECYCIVKEMNTAFYCFTKCTSTYRSYKEIEMILWVNDLFLDSFVDIFIKSDFIVWVILSYHISEFLFFFFCKRLWMRKVKTRGELLKFDLIFFGILSVLMIFDEKKENYYSCTRNDSLYQTDSSEG